MAGVIFLGYSLIYGMPFKKGVVAKELETHLEEKYGMDFHLQEAQYNFVDGNYSGLFYPEAQKELVFRAEKWNWNGVYYDEYPEAIWKTQLTQDLTPLVNQHFPEYEELQIIVSGGASHEMQTGKEIFHYKEAQDYIHLVINSSEKWSLEFEKKEAENLYNLIQELQKQNIALDISLYFNDEEGLNDSEKPVTHEIYVTSKDLANIQSIEDVLEYSLAF
ncbi:hypothetical protein [Planococcus halotolerans]|nr:hypothetical protein [Planococcus halotolerans]QHJ69595.1 hypothetical protein DNR44_002660 [Planococcus halotolerans]